MKTNSSFNRILAVVAIIATVFVMHFSCQYISEHTGHHCDDSDHCPICTMILQCENVVKTLGTGLIVAALIAFVSKVIEEVASYFNYQSIQTTLVSQKVRLDS